MAGNSISYPTAPEDSTVYSFSEAELAEIQRHMAKYPSKQSAVMPTLWIAQEKWGWLSPGAIQLVADTLEMSYAHVYGVATFYTMYLKDNRANHLVEVCTCFACGECGGEKLYQDTFKKLGCNEHGVSADGKVYLREAECLGACDTAPVVQINNRRMRYNVTQAQMDEIIERVKNGETLPYEPVPLYPQNF